MFQISLKAARINADMTQNEAARGIGVSRSTIINWESGASYPHMDQLKRLCSLYAVPIDCIFLREKST